MGRGLHRRPGANAEHGNTWVKKCIWLFWFRKSLLNSGNKLVTTASPSPLSFRMFTWGKTRCETTVLLQLSELRLLLLESHSCLSFPTCISIFFTEYENSRPPPGSIPQAPPTEAHSVPSGAGERMLTEIGHLEVSLGRCGGWTPRRTTPLRCPPHPRPAECRASRECSLSSLVEWHSDKQPECPAVNLAYKPSKQNCMQLVPAAGVWAGAGGGGVGGSGFPTAV